MSSNPLPNFHNFDKYQSLSTKKERNNYYSNFAPPPKAPVRSCPVPRIYSIFKDEAPRPVSFREDADSTFIMDSPLYSKKGGTYFTQCYSVEKMLGRGSFGEVFKVVSKENGQTFACKRTLLKYRGELDRTRRIEEVKKHEQLPPHENCVRFYRAWEEHNHLYLLTEVCECSLADILLDTHEFSESQLWAFLVDILKGLHHLHSHQLIHMDVKPENVFIGTQGQCKLGDFGLVIEFSQGYPSEAVEGDPKYLAPECLRNTYTPASDIFSLGIMMLEMATDLFLPQMGPQWHELRSGKIPPMDNKGLSPAFQDLLRALLEPNHERRITSAQAIELSCVRKVIRRRAVSHFFRKKAMAVKSFVASFLAWPLMLISLLCSILRRRIRFGGIEALGDLSGAPRYDRDKEPPLPSFPTPLVNSTPISYIKKREFIPSQTNDFSGFHNSDEDVVDGCSKYSFDDSSSLSGLEMLEATPSPVAGVTPVKAESRLSLNLSTARNLLDLFNDAESSEDDQ